MTRNCLVTALLFALLTCVFPPRAFACDLCAIHNAIELRRGAPSTFHLGVAEQLTHFGDLQEEGRTVDNEAGERMTSSITQLSLGYTATERIGVQLTLPVIRRSFRRLKDGGIDTGTESGVGDASLVGSYLIYSQEDPSLTVFWRLMGGVKLPTGDSDRLGEEQEEAAREDEATYNDHGEVRSFPLAHAGHHHHEEPQEAVHGHDLALGSGSIDTVWGSSLLLQTGKLFVTADLQYAVRTEGDFDYRYANDLIWSAGPGIFLVTHDEGTLALRAMFSGESKEKNVSRGNKEGDTALTSVFVGPGGRLHGRAVASRGAECGSADGDGQLRTPGRARLPATGRGELPLLIPSAA